MRLDKSTIQTDGKKIYFVSDAHLGASALNNNREREKRLIDWLESIKTSAELYFY